MNTKIKIKYDENGSIVDAYHTDIKIDGTYIIVDSDIWEKYSKYNKDDLQIKDNQIMILNNADKKLNIIKIKIKAGDIVESKYPLYKQLNITNLLDGYTQEDKTKMTDFIDSIRAISNKAELEGTALEDIDWGII